MYVNGSTARASFAIGTNTNTSKPVTANVGYLNNETCQQRCCLLLFVLNGKYLFFFLLNFCYEFYHARWKFPSQLIKLVNENTFAWNIKLYTYCVNIKLDSHLRIERRSEYSLQTGSQYETSLLYCIRRFSSYLDKFDYKTLQKHYPTRSW